MTNITSPEQILIYARTNNWLALFTSEGNILNVFLTPTGNILEVYFEKKHDLEEKEIPYQLSNFAP